MIVKEYKDFVDKVCDNNQDLSQAMKNEIDNLLSEFGPAYDIEADPGLELKICRESIMNLIYETRYEW